MVVIILLAFIFVTIPLIIQVLRQRKRLKAVNLRLHKLEESQKYSLEYIEALWASQKSLIQDEKLSSLNSLISRMAHELNTPLGVCLTSTTYIKDQLGTKANKKIASDLLPMTEMSLDNLQKSISLVDSLTEISSGGVQEKSKPVKLSSFIEFACYRDRYKEITFDIDSEAWVNISQYGLSIVLKNILDNAFDFGLKDQENHTISVSAHADINDLKIVIKDNGSGIKQKDLSHIFDPFYTTRRNDGHNGLGLTIAYNILSRSYNGNIKANSSTDRGTEFIINIPSVVCKKPN